MKTIFISYWDWEEGTACKESGDRHPNAIMLPDGKIVELEAVKTELGYTFADKERTVVVYHR